MERHDHFDAEGNRTGHTIVTREAEWDDDSRQAAYADWQIDADRCPQCKGPRSDCENPDAEWYPNTYTCWKTVAQRMANHTWEEFHKGAKSVNGVHPSDGRFIYLTKTDPAPGISWPSGKPIK